MIQKQHNIIFFSYKIFFNKTSKPIVNNTLFLVIYKINRSVNPIFNNTNVQLFFTDIGSLFIVKKWIAYDLKIRVQKKIVKNNQSHKKIGKKKIWISLNFVILFKQCLQLICQTFTRNRLEVSHLLLSYSEA